MQSIPEIQYYAGLDYVKLGLKKRRIDGNAQPQIRTASYEPTFQPTSNEPTFQPTSNESTFQPRSQAPTFQPRLQERPIQTKLQERSFQPRSQDSPYQPKSYDQQFQSKSQEPSKNYINSRNNTCFDGKENLDLKGETFGHSIKLKHYFEHYFKFKTFRQNQFEAINAACLNLDTLILMPTGGGKSICYQLPAVVSDGLTVVVSPLKSLIADQVSKLKSLNINTAALSSDLSQSDSNYIFDDLRSNNPTLKLLYVTPEKISASNYLTSTFEMLYSRGLLARFVIDEAHCVSMWGSDFRPDYRKLNILRQRFPSVPIMALTATAPPEVRLDILNQLNMNANAKVFLQSFNRPNLKFEVKKKSKNCWMDVAALISSKFMNKSGIVYCLSRDECAKVSQNLRSEGIRTCPYHAGLKDNERKNVFESWESNKIQVVCATIAFGMGIDKSDVRFVIHFSMPKSIEGYYQEAGRAGRDGKPAHCILFYSTGDIYRMKTLLRGGGGRRKDKQDKNKDMSNLEQINAYCNNISECRRTILLKYLGENFDRQLCLSNRETACDNCLRHK